MKLKRIAALRLNINADNLKSGLPQAHSRAASTAEKVESFGFYSHQHLVGLSVCVRQPDKHETFVLFIATPMRPIVAGTPERI
jgi:hypothetical protein